MPGDQLAAVNIWLFNPFDLLPWEGKPQRYATLAGCLAERGHEVVHWSSGFSHTFKQRRKVPAEFNPAELGYSIELVDCPAYTTNIGLRRVLNHRAYGKNLVADAAEAVSLGRHAAPDLIVASLPPMEAPVAALELRRQFGCRVVLDVMDAWPETLQLALCAPEVGGRRSEVGECKFRNHHSSFINYLSSIILFPYSRMLQRACREADAVCAQSQAFADFARRFGATGKIPVYYLGSQGNDFADAAEGDISKVHPVADPKGVLRIVYLGSMGRVYDLETLVDAALQLMQAGVDLRLDLVGEGAQRGALERRVQAAGQEGTISFHGYLTGPALAEVVCRADLGVVPMWPGSQVAVPYKVCDYLAAGLAVVNSLPGELADMLAEHGCGFPYEAGQTENLIQVLQALITNRRAVEEARSGARRLFSDVFDAEKIYPKYSAWLEGLASE